MPSDCEIVNVGGGHGVENSMLRLKKVLSKEDFRKVKAILTGSDDGNYSGELKALGYPPFGDFRLVGAAMSERETLTRVLANSRLNENHRSLYGVPHGSSLLAHIMYHLGKNPENFPEALNMYCLECGVVGVDRLLPVTLDYHSVLCSIDMNGTMTRHEYRIDTRSGKEPRIKTVFLDPPTRIYEKAYETLVSAKKIVIGPGSLFTSIVPNLITQGFREAIAESKATIILVLNLMTKDGESNRFLASDFARIICNHLGRKIDVVFCNEGPISEPVLFSYFQEKAEVIEIDCEYLKEYTNTIIIDDFVSEEKEGDKIVLRHNTRLARRIAEL